jgi:hypothetical protein
MFDEIGCIDVGCKQDDNYYFLLVYFPFISMECPLSHLINIGLKSTLSKISIAYPLTLGPIQIYSSTSIIKAMEKLRKGEYTESCFCNYRKTPLWENLQVQS